MRWARAFGNWSALIERMIEFMRFLCFALSAVICAAYAAIEAKTVAFMVIPMTTMSDAMTYSPSEVKGGLTESPITIRSVA